MVIINTQTDQNTYLYNGKEQDKLTGLYYYGARYYDCNKSTFLGVDPLVEKTMSSFAYCSNNPVILVDPDGMRGVPASLMRNGTYSTAQSTTYRPPLLVENLEGLRKQTQIPARSQATLSQYNPNPQGFNKDYLRKVEARQELDQKINDFVETGQALYPMQFGGGDFGFGTNKGIQDAAAQAPFVILPEIALAKLGQMTSAAKASVNILKPLGRGSTGRTVARSMSEKWTMKFVKDNPQLGEVIMKNMGDSRWSGWSKMQYIHRPVDGGRTVTVHYVGKWENDVLKAVDDFKFK